MEGWGSWYTPVLTLTDVDAAIERLGLDQQAIAEALLELDSHPGRKLLDSATLTGLTRQRWTAACGRLAALWAHFETYRAITEQIRRVRQRRSRPSGADLQELVGLLAGPAVTLLGPDLPLGERSLTGPRRAARQTTLAELVAEMKAAYADIVEVLVGADQVWSDLLPWMDQCGVALRALADLAAELNLAPGADPALDTVAKSTHALDELRRLAHADPIGLGVLGSVRNPEVERLASDIRRATSDLHALAQLREQADRRLDRIATLLVQITDVTSEAADERQQAQRRFSPSTLPPLAQPTHALELRLQAAMELRRRGRWRPLSAALYELERNSEAELERVRAGLAAVRAPSEQRSELRGRLGAYRAKAFALGRAEDVALEECYQRARHLLSHSPCELDRAAAALRAYQRAINGGASE